MKTEENQMKGRRSGMQTTSNECMASVLETRSSFLAIPEECVNVEDVAELLNRRDAPYIAQMLQSNHFSNAAGSRIITNLKPDVRDVYCFPVP